mmetsp:Transcript_27422/g.59661  ORF Transcript_27422/g.59661 Transcript_27422/m.59661 type:complete len:245 (+) Transcript_27422:197-931(+)
MFAHTLLESRKSCTDLFWRQRCIDLTSELINTATMDKQLRTTESLPCLLVVVQTQRLAHTRQRRHLALGRGDSEKDRERWEVCHRHEIDGILELFLVDIVIWWQIEKCENLRRRVISAICFVFALCRFQVISVVLDLHTGHCPSPYSGQANIFGAAAGASQGYLLSGWNGRLISYSRSRSRRICLGRRCVLLLPPCLLGRCVQSPQPLISESPSTWRILDGTVIRQSSSTTNGLPIDTGEAVQC